MRRWPTDILRQRGLVIGVLAMLALGFACGTTQPRFQADRRSPPSFEAEADPVLYPFRTLEFSDVQAGKGESWNLIEKELRKWGYRFDICHRFTGRIRTQWVLSSSPGSMDPDYRTRLMIDFSVGTWKTATLVCEANWFNNREWVLGTDTQQLDRVFADLQQAVEQVGSGRP